MAQKRQKTAQARALERAAKYICTAKWGLCPMVVEKYPCPQRCTLHTKPWQCWVAYFAAMQQAASARGNKAGSGAVS
jgi:hypothetical protein